MSSVMNNLQSTLSPQAMNAPASETLKSGKINHGVYLFGVFTKDEGETAKTDAIRSMVTLYGITVDEFKAACTQAQETATATDAANGFKAVEGATGYLKYGPKRATINARVSEWKALFGMFKNDPTAATGLGYFNAITCARAFHDARGLTWEGKKGVSAEEKQASRTSKATMKALEVAMKENTMQAGESYTAWMTRLGQIVEETQAEVAEQQEQEKVDALADRLMKQADKNMLQALINTLQTRLNAQPAVM